jgi:hypothetical protein
MDTEKQTVMRNHMQHIYHMWLTRDTQIFSSPLHTVTLHVIVFILMGGGTKLSKEHTTTSTSSSSTGPRAYAPDAPQPVGLLCDPKPPPPPWF